MTPPPEPRRERWAVADLRATDPRTVDHPDYDLEHAESWSAYGGVDGYLAWLVDDIAAHGVDELVEVEASGAVRDGNHRVTAARMAGLTHLDVLVYGT